MKEQQSPVSVFPAIKVYRFHATLSNCEKTYKITYKIIHKLLYILGTLCDNIIVKGDKAMKEILNIVMYNGNEYSYSMGPELINLDSPLEVSEL